jgi:hypothetical protein
VPKIKFEVYFKMKIVAEFNYFGFTGVFKHVSVTKSKLVVYNTFGTSNIIHEFKIQSLLDSGELIGVEFMVTHRIVVACTSRKCSFFSFDKSSPKERVVNLGENATSIFFNMNYALIGVVDENKNSLAFYRIEELIWPEQDSFVERYNPLDYRITNVENCKADMVIKKN